MEHWDDLKSGGLRIVYDETVFPPGTDSFLLSVGAFLGASKDGQDNTQALKAGIGSLLGFLLGTVLKFVVCGYFIWVFVRELI